MTKINKIPTVNNSNYAQQSRARHIHQEKYLDKQLKKFQNIQPPQLKNTHNYDTFLSTILTSIKTNIKKLIKSIK